MNAQQAAAWLDVPVEVVEDAVRAGQIPALTLGGHIRINQQSLRNLVGLPQSAISSSAEPEPRPLSSEPGLSPPHGMTWLTELTPAEPFSYRWPEGGPVEYPKAWEGTVQLQRATVAVQAGISEDGQSLLVLLDRYPLCEFHVTIDGAGFASLIKPDGRHVLKPGEPPPAFYQRATLALYREATGLTGIGVPKGMAVIVPSGDIRSAVHQAAARWLGKRNLPL